MGYHTTPVRTANIQKTKSYESWEGGREEDPLHEIGPSISEAIMEKSWSFHEPANKDILPSKHPRKLESIC